MKPLLLVLACLPLAALLAGCETNITPLRPLERVEMWIPDDGSKAIPLSKPVAIELEKPLATQPTTIPAEIHPIDVKTAATQPTTAPVATQMAATQPATAPATVASTEATTLPDRSSLPPGHEITKIIDPNQTARFVYNASYDNIWQQALLLVDKTGFVIDRHDYRLGVITTRSLPSSQFVEFWKPQHTNFTNAMENTVNSQRRYIRLTIDTVPGKPKFYEIAIQVLVERETNPSELLTGPLFIEGSGFGRNAVALRSDYADASTTMAPQKAGAIEKADPNRRWVVLGHDTNLEKKLLDQLFDRI